MKRNRPPGFKLKPEPPFGSKKTTEVMCFLISIVGIVDTISTFNNLVQNISRTYVVNVIYLGIKRSTKF
jgi:hypothetical protein